MSCHFGLPFPPLSAEGRVGQGVSGHVFRTVHEKTGTPLAVKVYPFDGIDPAFRARDRFWRECQMLSRLRHPSFPALFGCGEEDSNTGYAVMEWIDGEPLDKYRDAPVETVLRLSFRILSAMRALHQLGYIHRDMAFDNILVEKRRSGLLPRIIDLGVAKDVNAVEPITLPGSFLGRMAFAPPEALTSEGSLAVSDPKSDVFAFGVLLYHWLSGQPPFPGQTPLEILKSQQKRPVPKLKIARERGVGEDQIEPYILSLLERDIALRPDTQTAFQGLLELRRRLPLSKPPVRPGRPEDLLEEKEGLGWTLREVEFPARPRTERLLDVDPSAGAEIEQPAELTVTPEDMCPGAAEEPELPSGISASAVGSEIALNPWAQKLFMITAILGFIAACLAAYVFVFKK